MICPVCQNKDSEHFDQDKFRNYLKCSGCDLIFVPRTSLVSPEAEKERYSAHENDINQGYSEYLNKIVVAAKPFLKRKSVGLDFGCGKTHLLADLFQKHEFQVSSYDLFFHPDEDLLQHQYDFIILSEVIEHLRKPREELLKLKNLLKPDGQIFIKTKFQPVLASEFSKWFYKRDSTHVQFFNETSFREVAHILECLSFKCIGEDLFLFTR